MSQGVLKPAAVKFLAEVVAQHCLSHGIQNPEAKKSVAASALRLFEIGVRTEEDLLAALEREDNPGRRSA